MTEILNEYAYPTAKGLGILAGGAFLTVMWMCFWEWFLKLPDRVQAMCGAIIITAGILVFAWWIGS